MEENKQKEIQQGTSKKKYSTFQIVSAALIALLVVAIIVQIAVIINLKNRTDDLQNKLDKLPADETQEVEEQSLEDWQMQYLKKN